MFTTYGILLMKLEQLETASMHKRVYLLKFLSQMQCKLHLSHRGLHQTNLGELRDWSVGSRGPKILDRHRIGYNTFYHKSAHLAIEQTNVGEPCDGTLHICALEIFERHNIKCKILEEYPFHRISLISGWLPNSGQTNVAEPRDGTLHICAPEIFERHHIKFSPFPQMNFIPGWLPNSGQTKIGGLHEETLGPCGPEDLQLFSGLNFSSQVKTDERKWRRGVV
ncbi:hypothetical protein FB451DRAFT_1187907 [Mycena latifolia]|nr:hypothetical protein FB451DRAFT_1187907 [Mycena latifolia]